VRRLRARDEGALGELYDILAPWVLGLAFRILRDEDEAEEVVGDVFVQVWRHVDQHDARRALDALRRRQRWWRKAERLEAQSMEAGDETVAAPHEAAVPGWPLHREVHAALAALPDEQRRLIVLSYFEGLSHSEIARRLKQPLGTVKTRLRSAHQKLTDGLRHLKDWVE